MSLSDSPSRVLAIRLDNIGDVVMTGPALRALKEAYPSAHLTLMASPGGAQAAPLLPWVDEVIPWRAVWQDIAKNVPVQPEKEYELVALLEKRRFDAAFIFTSFSQSPHPPAYVCYLAGIPIRVGQTREFGGGLLSHWVKPLPDEVYQVERNLHLVREAGLPVRSSQLELQVQEEDQYSAAGLLLKAGIVPEQPYLVLAPGASAASRRYPEAGFVQVARQLAAETGIPVVLIGSQKEAGMFQRLQTLAAENPRVISLIGRTSVPEMAAILRRSAGLIANNSGAMHIAAAFNRPMVILFAGTELLNQWVPQTAGVRILNRPTVCAPCHAFDCRYHLECLDFSPEEVVDAARRLWEAEPARPTSFAGTNPGITQRFSK